MNGVDIKVWGCYACFTRPEFKVERVSYPVMTPAAARGILEAIYWKPQLRYRILRIGILEIGNQMSILRNEISSRQAEKSENLLAEQDRQQRTSLVLQDVAYRIQARIELCNGESNIGKHLDCLRRRVERGQYHHKPCLGCREFPAEFEAAEDVRDTPNAELTMRIGNMLFDTAYVENEDWYRTHKENRIEFWHHSGETLRLVKGYAKRLFFDAEVRNGWLTWPADHFFELMRLEGHNGASKGAD